MQQLRTAGDLRTFLAQTLIGIRDGSIDANKANAISKVASQINQSLSTEVATKLKLKELGQDAAGEMLIGSASEPVLVIADASAPGERAAPVRKPPTVIATMPADKVWCDQCDLAVTPGQAVSCKSPFCKAKEAA